MEQGKRNRWLVRQAEFEPLTKVCFVRLPTRSHRATALRLVRVCVMSGSRHFFPAGVSRP